MFVCMYDPGPLGPPPSPLPKVILGGPLHPRRCAPPPLPPCEPMGSFLSFAYWVSTNRRLARAKPNGDFMMGTGGAHGPEPAAQDHMIGGRGVTAESQPPRPYDSRGGGGSRPTALDHVCARECACRCASASARGAVRRACECASKIQVADILFSNLHYLFIYIFCAFGVAFFSATMFWSYAQSLWNV